MLPESDTVRIRCLPFLYELDHRPILPNDTFLGWVGILGFITLLSEIAIGTLCWFAFALPRRQRDIYRHGLASVGTVTRLEALGNTGSASTIYYRFEIRDDPRNPPKVVQAGHEGDNNSRIVNPENLGEMRITREQANSIHVDDNVTVLYLPKDPDMNVIYKFGMYRVKARGIA